MRLVQAVFALGLLCTQAQAAELTRGGDDYMGCIATLSGPIVKGDADRLASLLPDLQREIDAAYAAEQGIQSSDSFSLGFQAMRLCLNSPGGSLSEAIRMGDILHDQALGTAVPRGARCESACAVLFLSGTEMITGDGLLGANRVMHATSRLGFHAPSLAVPDNTYSKDQVERAYKIAIAGLGALSQRKHAWQLSDSLLTTILTTPPEAMTYVETTFDAGRLNIPVVGTVYPDKVTPLAAANACTKNFAYLQGVDPDYQTTYGTTAKDRFGISPQLTKGEYDDREKLLLSGFGDEGNWHGCTIGLPIETRDAFDAANASGNSWPYQYATISWRDGIETGIMPAMFFDNRLALRDIARPRDDALEFRSVLQMTAPDEARQARGICSVWRGQDRRDQDPCELDLLTTTDDEAVKTVNRTFTWPSGSKTVVVVELKHASSWEYVNGSEASTLYEWDNPPVPEGTCWLNRGSGNTFCFEEAS